MKRIASMLLILVLFTGCAIAPGNSGLSEDTQNITSVSTSVPVTASVEEKQDTEDKEKEEPIEEPKEKTLSEMDEQEIREYIANCGDDEAGINNRKAGYEELIALDVMTAADFYDYAVFVRQTGDEAAATDILWDMYRLFPTEETFEQLSVWETRLSEMPEWATTILTGDDFINTVTGLITSGAWAEAYMWPSASIPRRIVCSTEDCSIIAESDALAIRIIAEYNDSSKVLFEYNSGNSVYYREIPTDSVEKTSFLLNYAGKNKQRFEGTFREDYCVGDFAATISGTKYTGKLTDKGITKEEQISTVKGVIFAYDSKKKKYLYESGVKKDDFKITKEYLGVPEFSFE